MLRKIKFLIPVIIVIVIGIWSIRVYFSDKAKEMRFVRQIDSFDNYPNSQPVSVIWYSMNDSVNWKIYKRFDRDAKLKQFKAFIDTEKLKPKLEHRELDRRNLDRKAIIANIKCFPKNDKLVFLYYKPYSGKFEVREVYFRFIDGNFVWPTGSNRGLYDILNTQEQWQTKPHLINTSGYHNFLRLSQRQNLLANSDDLRTRDEYSLDWINEVYVKSEWLPVKVLWHNIVDTSEDREQGVYKSFSYLDKQIDFINFIELLAYPERHDTIEIEEKTKLTLIFYDPEHEIIDTRWIWFELKDGICYMPHGSSQELGEILLSQPDFIEAPAIDYTDFEPDNLIKLQEDWSISSPTENIKED